MRIALLIMSLWLLGSQIQASEIFPRSECSLMNSMNPECYHDRNGSFMNVALVYYGDFWKQEDLERLAPILKKRFEIANSHKIKLNILYKEVIPFKHTLPDGYENNGITDKKRLLRLWYYDNIGSKVMQEVHEQIKSRFNQDTIHKLDAILAVTGAQFQGLGFAYGRVSVTEQPQEIAWALKDKGRTEVLSDYRLVDELIHELGHNMFLGHTSTHCTKRGMSAKEQRACCAKSPSRNDVLSYCRNRNKVDENFMHGYEECNQSMIEELVIPALTSGGNWKIRGRKRCR